MKLREFLDGLNELVKSRPDVLDFIVVAAKDDEGNGFNEVVYDPSFGLFEDGEFSGVSSEDEDEDGIDPSQANAICVN